MILARRGSAVAAALLALALQAGEARGQALSSAEAAFSAIMMTPIGGLPQVTRIDLPADSMSRAQLRLRYGAWQTVASDSVFSTHIANFGATGLFRLTRRVSVGGTVGVRRCDACEQTTIASADVETALFHQTNERNGEGFFDLALQGSVGYATTTNVSAVSVGGWLPMSVSLPEPNSTLLTIAFAPGVAYGRLSDDSSSVLGAVGSAGGPRVMAAASISYLFDGPLGVHANLQRVMLNNSPTHFGIAASWRFGAPRQARRR